MAFITPLCARLADLRCGSAMAAPTLAFAVLAGCSQGQPGYGFDVESIETHMTMGALDAVVHQNLVLSKEARNALDHGVPLTIETEFTLRTTGSRRAIEQAKHVFEIRYLPLSERYQLTTRKPFSISTFPRLRHALAQLRTVSFTLPATPLPVGNLELSARSFLDKSHMPPPMRLPVWFSSQWRHDSGWRSWPLRPDSGT